MSDYTVQVDAEKFSDTKTIFFVVTSGTDVCLDAWQATEAQTVGIRYTTADEPVSRQTYDLSGRRLSPTRSHQGIVIEQYTDKTGKKHSRKRM